MPQTSNVFKIVILVSSRCILSKRLFTVSIHSFVNQNQLFLSSTIEKIEKDKEGMEGVLSNQCA